MPKLLSALCIALSLVFAPGCARPPAPTASPVALAPDVEKYLQEFAKIKTEVHENLGSKYDKAADAQTRLLQLEKPLAERQKAAPEIKREMKEVVDGLAASRKKLAGLTCPPACKAMEDKYVAYLESMEKEANKCIQVIDLSVQAKVNKGAYLAAMHELTGINTSRNIEMANYVAELKKVATGQSATPGP